VTAFIRSADVLSAETVFEYDYSNLRITADEVWGIGTAAGVSATLDRTERPHAVVDLRRSAQGGWAPSSDLYIFRDAFSWTSAEDVATDVHVQVEQGNTRGARYSGFQFALGYHAAADRLHLFGYDAAWYGVKYNVLTSSAAPGSRSWPELEVVETHHSGVVDRGAFDSTDQDFAGEHGVQVWVDKPTCSVRGRELVDGAWTRTIDIALEHPGCLPEPSAHYGFSAHVQAVLAEGEVIIAVGTRAPADGVFDTLFIIRRRNGVWSKEPRPVDWSAGGGHTFRLFAHGGRPMLVYKDAAQRSIWLLDLGTGREIRLHRVEFRMINQIDIERRDPRVIVWTERSAVEEQLFVADLEL
jgi:hypothetical protein